ncbi:MAG: hypothetical protein ACOYD4_17900 [Solirubrobacterales bacterium]
MLTIAATPSTLIQIVALKSPRSSRYTHHRRRFVAYFVTAPHT